METQSIDRNAAREDLNSANHLQASVKDGKVTLTFDLNACVDVPSADGKKSTKYIIMGRFKDDTIAIPLPSGKTIRVFLSASLSEPRISGPVPSLSKLVF